MEGLTVGDAERRTAVIVDGESTEGGRGKSSSGIFLAGPPMVKITVEEDEEDEEDVEFCWVRDVSWPGRTDALSVDDWKRLSLESFVPWASRAEGKTKLSGVRSSASEAFINRSNSNPPVPGINGTSFTDETTDDEEDEAE